MLRLRVVVGGLGLVEAYPGGVNVLGVWTGGQPQPSSHTIVESWPVFHVLAHVYVAQLHLSTPGGSLACQARAATSDEVPAWADDLFTALGKGLGCKSGWAIIIGQSCASWCLHCATVHPP